MPPHAICMFPHHLGAWAYKPLPHFFIGQYLAAEAFAIVVWEALFHVFIMMSSKTTPDSAPRAGNIHREHYGIFNSVHESAVFGGPRQYRVILPEDYATSGKRYPVIFLLHGWSGFNRATYRLDWLEGEFPRRNEVIIILPDGYVDPSYRWPYNLTGEPPQRDVLYADYFMELVAHVDETYRTKADRESRAIYGHSMGGFMSFHLAGKFPHLFGSAVNNMGSPEYFLGTSNRYYFYRNSDHMGNLEGLRVRFINGKNCFLNALNREAASGLPFAAELDAVYSEPELRHQVDAIGETAYFASQLEFLLESFDQPATLPRLWRHIDASPRFAKWGWEVEADLGETGHVVLERVGPGGLRARALRWPVDGAPIPGARLRIQSAPIYPPNEWFELQRLDADGEEISSGERQQSDLDGRLCFELAAPAEHLAIRRAGFAPEPVLVAYRFESGRFLRPDRSEDLWLRIWNRGGSPSLPMQLQLSSPQAAVEFQTANAEIPSLATGETTWVGPFHLTRREDPPPSGERSEVAVRLHFRDEQGQEWADFLELPVWEDVPVWRDVEIEDGRPGLTAWPIQGRGNGNGIAEAGERILLTRGGIPLFVQLDDPRIPRGAETLFLTNQQPEGIHSLDAINRATRLDLPADLPDGTRIHLLARQEIETRRIHPGDPSAHCHYREVHWGQVELIVHHPKSE